MTPDLSRFHDWIDFLREQAESDPDLRVVWIGGSAATGGWDQWSDLDVDLLCTPGETTAVYDRLLKQTRATFDVDHVWELPLAAWPDGRQCFVNHQHRPGALEEPTRIVDLHFSDLSDQRRSLDVRRHGTPIVLFDPDGQLVLQPDDQSELETAAAEAVDQARQRRATAEWLVNRAIVRGQLPEATELYLRFALGVVVRLLRVRHCPWRHDFGLRYLHTDLPTEAADRVSALLPGNAPLEDLSSECFAWMDELLETS
jgi:predicted nucleotidyltransferase